MSGAAPNAHAAEGESYTRWYVHHDLYDAKDAHRAGFAAGAAYERERIAGWLERQAEERPDRVQRLLLRSLADGVRLEEGR